VFVDSLCRRVEGTFAQRGIGRVDAIDRKLIGRGVGILFDPLAPLAGSLEGFVCQTASRESRHGNW
jgi:hypothetical protein